MQLSLQDEKTLREILRAHRERKIEDAPYPDSKRRQPPYPDAEIYLALVPASTGIPPMTRTAGTASGSEDAPGRATCDIYLPVTVGTAANATKLHYVTKAEVLNVFMFRLLGTKSSATKNEAYVPVARAASGHFIAIPNESMHALFITPSGGIAARSGSTLGSATCTRQFVNNGSLAAASFSETVYNLSTTAVAGSTYIGAKMIDGVWLCDWEDCG